MNPKMKNNEAFILNLPPKIIIDILTRLPIQSMISCKCVCKKWLQLFSNPDFSKFHLSKPTPGLIVQLTQNKEKFCKIVEFEDILDLQNHNLHYKAVLKFDPSSFTSSDFTRIMCSVNGLICFHEYINELDAFYICNPMTREYITLPRPNGNTMYPNIVTYGLGVSSVTSQYKVVRIFHEPLYSIERESNLRNLKVECIVYTLGTGSWRSIEPGEPYEYDTRPSVGTFLNGNLHWLVYDSEGVMLILCLDLETELFKPFSRAPFLKVGGSLTVLEDCYLCFCDFSSDEEIVIWIMKEYGVEDSWTKEVVIDKCQCQDLGGITYEAVYVLKVFKDGEILMLWEDTCLFYYCDKTKSAPEVDLFEQDNGYINALLHISSFVSLGRFALENVSSF
ncbi:hypothetical protein RD792_011048 [Penstemon davidsonii]|uniref:F-box domain-containing protein n=1 Tax=Penstemon davidsonii TaxID=160366 RepID=A0ABR0D3I0_9LAMI|nr:hypothetical protein RD792_011048 [Penstemon davidsonii]